MNKNIVIAVALSGGVDSLVAGYILKNRYKNIFGIHFTTGYEKECIDLTLIEKQLGFPVTSIDLSKEFEDKVIQYRVSAYAAINLGHPVIQTCNIRSAH